MADINALEVRRALLEAIHGLVQEAGKIGPDSSRSLSLSKAALNLGELLPNV